MKEIIVNNTTYLFVKVPDDAYDLGMETDCEVSYKISSAEYKRINTSSLDFIFNVNGIIGFTKDITEEQAGGIVEEAIEDEYQGYRHYHNKLYQTEDDWCSHYLEAKESLQSLIQANGLDITKNYLILRKL